MIHRINDTIEMKDLPTWLQELWEQNPSLARRAEKHYLELKEQCNIPYVVGRSEQLKAFAQYLDEIHGGEDFAVNEIDGFLKSL